MTRPPRAERACEQCNAAYQARRRDARYCSQRCSNIAYYAAHRAEILARGRVHGVAYRAAHAGERASAQRRRYLLNREQLDAYRREWASLNPHRQRLINQVLNANATAKRMGLPGRLRTRDIEHLPRICVYCGSAERLTIDHATPVSRGGENHWSNLTTACLSCNDRKGTRTVAEFLDLAEAA